MDATNTVSHELEKGHAVCIFSEKEVTSNILGLMQPLLFSITQVEPIWADMNSGVDRLPDYTYNTIRPSPSLNEKSKLQHAKLPRVVLLTSRLSAALKANMCRGPPTLYPVPILGLISPCWSPQPPFRNLASFKVLLT